MTGNNLNVWIESLIGFECRTVVDSGVIPQISMLEALAGNCR